MGRSPSFGNLLRFATLHVNMGRLLAKALTDPSPHSTLNSRRATVARPRMGGPEPAARQARGGPQCPTLIVAPSASRHSKSAASSPLSVMSSERFALACTVAAARSALSVTTAPSLP